MSSSNGNVFKKSDQFQPKKIVQTGNISETGFRQVRLSNGTSAPYQPSPLYDPNAQPLERRKPESRSPTEPPTHKTPGEDEDLLFQDMLSPEQEQPQPDHIDNTEIEQAPEPEIIPEPVVTAPAVDIEQIRQDAYNKGFEEAQKLAQEEYQTSGDALFNIAEQLNTVREVIIQNSIGEMQDLVITIAEKIIRHSITAQDDTIAATVEESIRKAVKSSEFYVCLNKNDYSVINEKAPELVSKISGLENIFIKIDDTIEPGGCIIESDNCTVDATIASQLQIIKEHFTSRR